MWFFRRLEFAGFVMRVNNRFTIIRLYLFPSQFNALSRLNPPQLRRPASPGGLGICLRLGSGGGASPSESSLPSILVSGDPPRLSAYESYRGVGSLGLPNLGTGERPVTLSYGDRTARRFLRILQVRSDRRVISERGGSMHRFCLIFPVRSVRTLIPGRSGRTSSSNCIRVVIRGRCKRTEGAIVALLTCYPFHTYTALE